MFRDLGIVINMFTLNIAIKLFCGALLYVILYHFDVNLTRGLCDYWMCV